MANFVTANDVGGYSNFGSGIGVTNTGVGNASAGAGAGAAAGGAGGAGNAMTAMSGLSSVVGTLIEGRQKRDTYRFNAAMTQIEARQIRMAADMDIKRMRKNQSRFWARQQALYARAGVKMEGSPLDVMAETQAQMYRAEGKSAMRDARGSSIRTILNTATSVAGGM